MNLSNVEDKIGDSTADLPGAEQQIPEVAGVEQGGGIDLGGLRSLLMTPTGPGAVLDYIDHPMNYDKSEGLAQMLRGLTGFTDNLALAVVDVIIGMFRWKKDKAAPVVVTPK